MPRKYKKVADCPDVLREVLDVLNGCPSDPHEITPLVKSWMALIADGHLGVRSLYIRSITASFVRAGVESAFPGDPGLSILAQRSTEHLLAAETLDLFPDPESRSLLMFVLQTWHLGNAASSTGSTRRQALDELRGPESDLKSSICRTLFDLREQNSCLRYAIAQFQRAYLVDQTERADANAYNNAELLIATNGGNIRDFLVKADGTIKCMSLDVMALIQDLRINLARLGICPSCDRIFWKKKSDSKTCGRKSCAVERDNKVSAPERHRRRKERLNVNLQKEKQG